MEQDKWLAWKMQTSKQWRDVEEVMKVINIDFIDSDHHTLIELALKLNQVIDTSQTEFSMSLIQETEQLLKDFYDYAKIHFDREETFMIRYNLSDIESHQREHNQILNMLQEHLDAFKAGKIVLDMKIKYQIMEWLIHHINVVDFNFFAVEKWRDHLVKATEWDQVKEIIFVTGIPTIDRQHQELTEEALQMIEGLHHDSHFSQLSHLINQYEEHILEHFEFEESFMNRNGINQTDEHLSCHSDFKKRLKEISVEIQLGKLTLDEFKSWILLWWIDHINGVDRVTFDYHNWAYHLIEKSTQLSEVKEILRRTGIESIDHEHLEVMEEVFYFNQMVQKMTASGNLENTAEKEAFEKCLNKILTLAKQHFHHEEQMMEAWVPSELVSHRLEHGRIIRQMETLLSYYKSGCLIVTDSIKTMILDWWLRHTNTIDYRTFVRRAPKGGELNE